MMRRKRSCVPQATPPMATSPGAVTDQGNCALHACAEMGRGRVGHAPPAPINTVLKDGGGGRKEKEGTQKRGTYSFFRERKGKRKVTKTTETKRKEKNRGEQRRKGKGKERKRTKERVESRRKSRNQKERQTRGRKKRQEEQTNEGERRH